MPCLPIDDLQKTIQNSLHINRNVSIASKQSNINCENINAGDKSYKEIISKEMQVQILKLNEKEKRKHFNAKKALKLGYTYRHTKSLNKGKKKAFMKQKRSRQGVQTKIVTNANQKKWIKRKRSLWELETHFEYNKKCKMFMRNKWACRHPNVKGDNNKKKTEKSC